MGAAIVLIASFGIISVQAIHNPGDTSLELDGNVADNPAGAPDDWNQSPAFSGTFTTTGIVQDPDNATIFTGAQSGGSSKDGQDVSGWRWKCGSVPAKDEIFNAASVKYTIGTEKRLYFMADREATNGDSHIGVWFFRKSIATVPATGCATPGTFSDVHTAHSATDRGDILVLADFTNGGANVDIKAFEWYGTGGNDSASKGALNFIGESGNCVGQGPHPANTPELCATSNTIVLGPGSGADTTAGTNDDGPAWAFTPKSGANGSYPVNSFFEGGIDLNSLGLQGECFGSVLTETRSSDSTDAILKDFVVSPFEPCTSGITTNASAGPVTVGGTFSDTATVTGSGAGDPTGTVTFTVCGPFTTPTACTAADPTAAAAGVRTLQVDGTPGNPAIVTSDLVNATGVGYYCFLGVYSGGGGYSPGSDSDITRECVQVVTVPTVTTTRQSVFPQDKAKIAAAAGGNLAGNVRFRLFNTAANCLADDGTATATGLLYDSGNLAISGASPQFGSTNNTTARVSSDSTVAWHVTYDSTNPAQDDSESDCTETTAIDFTGDDSSITP
jgi:hypothetical protein